MKVISWKYAVPPNFVAVPEKPGIYILSTNQAQDQSYVVTFVGETENLRAQAMEHFSKSEKNKELKAHIAEKYIMKLNYSEVASKSDREGMVAYLYQTFNPPFNHPLPDKGVIVCTVPPVKKH
jgi:excinuclease UvrABC nuclease subunit